MSGLGRLASRRPATTFTVLTYLFSWTFWIPAVLMFVRDPRITVPGLVLALLGTYGPTFAAFALTGATDGRNGVRELAARFVRPGRSWWWPVLSLVLPLLVFLGAVRLRAAGDATLPAPRWEQLTAVALLGRVAFALPFGPLGEEAGWRGYLLPALEQKMSPLVASLVIGVVWTFWHLPMFWVPGVALPSSVAPSIGAIGLYLAGVTATSIVATALYHGSGDSLMVAVGYHLGTNLWHQVLAPVLIGDATAAWSDLRVPALIANLVAAAACLVVLKPSLGRRPPPEEPPLPRLPCVIE